MPQFAPGLRRVLAARKPAAPKQKLELRQEWACVPLRAPFLAPFRIEKRQPLFNRVMLTEVVASKNPLPVKIHSLRGTLPTLQIASSDVWWPPSPQRHISRHHHEYRFHHSRPRLLPPSCLHPRSDEPAKQGGVAQSIVAHTASDFSRTTTKNAKNPEAFLSLWSCHDHNSCSSTTRNTFPPTRTSPMA